jgi:general secretion pathway protein G
MQTDDPDQISKEAGYTLAELIVVIVVLSLVAAAITPAILSRFNNSQRRSAQLQAGTISAAMDEFFVDVGRYPAPDEGVEALWAGSDEWEGWSGPYVRTPQSLIDPWGNEFVIVASEDENIPPRIVSYGSDGTEGGEGRAQDIVYPESMSLSGSEPET